MLRYIFRYRIDFFLLMLPPRVTYIFEEKNLKLIKNLFLRHVCRETNYLMKNTIYDVNHKIS